MLFFFKQNTAYEMRISDWSSDVFSSDHYFNYNFSPITADDGRIEGVFNAVLETTPRVVASRHQRVLIDLIAETASATSVEEAFAGRSEARRVGKEGDRACRPR